MVGKKGNSRAKRQQVRYTTDSEVHIQHITEKFKKNLSRIAHRIANHDNVDRISSVHVDNAYDTLCRCALLKGKWYSKSQFKMTISSACLGIAAYWPSIIPYLINEKDVTTGQILFWTGSIALFILFLAFFLWGWFQKGV